jgi:two-component system, LuxR family, sensor kinase FixL
MSETDPNSLEEVNQRLKQEVAHRRRAEEANATFAAIVENSNDAIVGQKLDGTIVTWNKGAERIFGFTTDEACGRPVSILVPDDREEDTKRITAAIRRGESIEHYETDRIRKDGTRISVSLTISPIRDSTGRIVGASRISRDVTAQKQMEQALRESEARGRAILDTAVDAIITIDTTGVVELFNKSAERLFGYAPADVIGKNVSILMPDPYRSLHDGYLRNYLLTGEAKIISIGREVIARRKDGTTFPADLAVSEVQLRDRRIFTGIVRDISERKRLEREILEISDREKRRIGQDLHDSLGQLLTGIGFKSKSLHNKLSAKQLPEAENAGQIANLVTDAIREARALARGLEPVESGPNGLMTAFQQLAAGIEDLFKVSCVFQCPQRVEIDNVVIATQLYRIAQEACHNAVKHGRATLITIELLQASDMLRLTISNDGVEFPATQENMVGMGLRSMRYRAALMSGTVSISPGASGGTVVCCQAPVRK